MSSNNAKIDFPPENVRKYLEPGPVVLISSQWQDEHDIMTLGWHTIMEFSPSLVGCMISAMNHSHQLIRASGECVINLPTADLVDKVVAIGNSSGTKIDKFSANQLTASAASKVQAPLIAECYANFECRLYDDALVENYNFFIFEVVKAHICRLPEYPQTLHYTGDGIFTLSGDRHLDKSADFRPEML
ncbi:flavin reductase family protein [Erwiniaceae bacterium BAC15a-03b]|uniref:Flavin reductase family protein n=1 Tax=Winslowiella arboricola TaxID=2978220 RepID=A0A9J6PWH9_9GAMM|nr:flavin reductase family protein [Winslowiella arboricola]MCU5773318.1 flavin reductase family protein [Winslowiella arboricola]MCU5779204.1 flavin reductase family protein [Winslowiella arboricola]